MVFPYVLFIVSFMILMFLLEAYIDWRQYNAYKNTPKMSSVLVGVVNEETFTKSKEYQAVKLSFGMFKNLADTCVNVCFICFFLLPYLWGKSGELLLAYGYSVEENEILHSLVFLATNVIFNTVFDLPFSLYHQFVIEEKFGFNKSTIKIFFTDMVKMLALTVVLGGPITAVIIKIIRWGGENFWVYTWLFTAVLVLFFMVVYPVLLAPLFNTFTSLPEGELKSKIEGLAKEVGFPLTKLFVVDGSKRSAHSNAYMYGFFKNKRIVLYDTLLTQFKDDDKGILAILAHELGHWQMSHTVFLLLITQFQTLFFFWSFGQFLNNSELYQDFGFETKPVIIGLSLFTYLYHPIEAFIKVLMNAVVRTFEYQADRYAHTLGFDLRSPLVTIHVKNLGNLSPDWLYSMWNHSHPTLVERVAALEALGPVKQKEE